MKPVAIDLFCGLGGWTDGLLAEGWDVTGYDIEAHEYDGERYPARLVLRDVREIHGSEFAHANLIVASPPCQEFSYMAMPWKRAKQIGHALRGEDEFPNGYKGSRTRAELTALFDACFRIQREASAAAGRHIPLVVENVRGAQPWVGKAAGNFGSFYLWGDLPEGMPRPEKAHKNPGFRFDGSGRSFQSESVERHVGDSFGWSRESDLHNCNSKSPRRKAASARIAKIPFTLSSWVARMHKPISSAPISIVTPEIIAPKLYDIRVGDCHDLLRDIPDESVHCVVTSPPYFGLRDYGTATWIGGDPSCKHKGSGGRGAGDVDDKYPNGPERSASVRRGGNPHKCLCGAVRLDSQIGLEQSVSEHIEVLVALFRDVRRVLRRDGTLWLNYGDAYASSVNGRSAADTKITGKDDRTFRDKSVDTVRASGLKPKDLMMLPARLALALQDDGWWLRSDIIWAKSNPMPESCQDRPTSAHEHVFLLTKQERYFYDADAIKTPIKEVSAKRLMQPNFDGQGEGASKDEGCGNRSHRKALVNQREKLLDRQSGHGRRHAGFNERWDTAERLVAQEKWDGRHDGHAASVNLMVGANARNVWTISTEPFAGEFCTACQTFYDGPDKKRIRVEKVEGRNTRFCECGRSDAWLSHFATFPTELARRCVEAGSPTQCCSACGAGWKRMSKKIFWLQADVSLDKNLREPNQHDSLSRRAGSARGTVHSLTAGFEPSCNCNAPAVPSTVLDPFGGAGTVAVVASRANRASILLELNPQYAAMAERRIAQDKGRKKEKRARTELSKKPKPRKSKRPDNVRDLEELIAESALPNAPEAIANTPFQRPRKKTSPLPLTNETVDLEEMIEAAKPPTHAEKLIKRRSTKIVSR